MNPEEDSKASFEEAREKEKRLKLMLKTSSKLTDEIISLQGEIQKCFLDCAVKFPSFASSMNIEVKMWNTCFQKRIEEFRTRIDRCSSIAIATNEPDRLQLTRERLHLFLVDISSNYQTLLETYEKSFKSCMENKYLKKSIHKCLVFLGDLSRYIVMYCYTTLKDFSNSENFYQRALEMIPDIGNPHNHMAVIAMYNDAECVAVYRYCRSLLVRQPFLTARDNLEILFERNKHKLRREEGKDENKIRNLIGGKSMPSLKISGKNCYFPAVNSISGGRGSGGRGNTGALLKSFLLRFVRLNGILFMAERDELPHFAEMFPSVINDFRTLLYYSAFGDALLLKMVMICTFTIIVCESKVEVASNASKNMDEDMREVCLSWALALSFSIVAQIGGHVRTQNPIHNSTPNRNSSDCLSENEVDTSLTPQEAYSMKKDFKKNNSCQARPLGSRLLGPVVLFCEWLKVQQQFCLQKPQTLNEESISSNHTILLCKRKAREQEKIRRAEFWDVVCHLANALPDTLSNSNDHTAKKASPLKEHLELIGYLPFEKVLEKYEMEERSDEDSSGLGLPLDDRAGSMRILGIKAFCTYMSSSEDLSGKMKTLIVKDASSGAFFTAVDGASKPDFNAKPFALKQVPISSNVSPNRSDIGGKSMISVSNRPLKYKGNSNLPFLHPKSTTNMTLRHTKSWNVSSSSNRDKYFTPTTPDTASIWGSNRRDIATMYPTEDYHKSYHLMPHPSYDSGMSAHQREEMPSFRQMQNYRSFERKLGVRQMQTFDSAPPSLMRTCSQPDVILSRSSLYESKGKAPLYSKVGGGVGTPTNRLGGNKMYSPEYMNLGMYSNARTPLASWGSSFSSDPSTSTKGVYISSGFESNFSSVFNGISLNAENESYNGSNQRSWEQLHQQSKDASSHGSNIKGSDKDDVVERDRIIRSLRISPDESFTSGKFSKRSSITTVNESPLYSHFQMRHSPFPLQSGELTYGLDDDTPKTVIDHFGL